MRRAIHLRIIHRNRLFRECLASVLSDGQRLEVRDIDHAEPGFLEALTKQPPDVVLIDLNLPDQLAPELTQHIREHLDRSKVILLAYANEQDNLVECIAAGAHGCVLEESSLSHLRVAVEKVVGGETFCSPEIVHSMFNRLAQTARDSYWHERPKAIELTPRELEVVHLIAERLSNKQIAQRLSLSLYTVKNHVHNIVEKLQVGDRFEAVEYARRRRWLQRSRTVRTVVQDG